MTTSTARLLPALAAVYVIWGSTYLAIRFAIETMPPFLMAGTRFLVAGGMLYVTMRLRGARRPVRVQWRDATIVGALLLLGGNGAVVWAQQRVASGLAALLVATEPLWVVIVDWIRPRGRRPALREALGLLIGFGGALWLITPAHLVSEAVGVDLLGAAVVVFAAVSWAIGSVYSRYATEHESPFLMTAMKMLSGGGLLILVGLVTGEWSGMDIGAISLKSLGAYLYLIFAGSLVAFTAYIWLLKQASLALASTYAYVNPAVAIFLGWALADEPLGLRVLLATAIIITAVVVISTVERGQRDPPVSGSPPVVASGLDHGGASARSRADSTTS